MAPRKGNKNAVGNVGGSGRPPIYNDTFPERAFRLALLGVTNVELAAAFGVGETTIETWTRDHIEFSEALYAGKVEADSKVSERLYQRALGYSHKAVKIFMPSGTTEPIYADYVEHYPPDTAAAKHWLNNRRPREWRERIEHSGDPERPVSFLITNGPDPKA